MRALAYCRQSDSGGAGINSLSIESMETELRRWAEAEGWELVGVIRETDVRGWQDETQRPGLMDALDRARERAYDVLLVWDMSRFARSVRIQEDLIYRLAAHGVEVRSKTEPHLTHSPLIRQVLGAVAEERTREISKHIRRALREKTRRGQWHGPTPYGYQRGQDGRLVPVEDESPIVAEIVQRGASGESWWAIAHDLNIRGVGYRGSPWNHRKTRAVAINPVHVGVCWAGDEWTEDAHPAIVDRGLWERCRERTQSRRRAPRRDSYPTFLAGRAYCGCGWPMYAVRSPVVLLRCRSQTQRGERCTHHPRSIYIEAAEAFVREQVNRDLEQADPWREAFARAKADQRNTEPRLVSERARLTAAQARLEGRRSRLVDTFVDGIIGRDELAAKVAPIDADIAAITAQLAETPEPPDAAAFREAGAIVTALRGVVPFAAPDAMAAALVALRATVHLEGDGLRIKYGSPFDRMLGVSR